MRSFHALTWGLAIVAIIAWTAAAVAVLSAPTPDPVAAVALIVVGVLGAASCIATARRNP